MIDSSRRHHRRSIRLRGYDYTQPGAYFVTICTQERACWFGEIVDGEMRLNALEEIVREEWFKSADVRPNVVLRRYEFVAMPNHIYGIMWIVGDDDAVVVGARVGAQRRCAPTDNIPTNVIPGSLGAIIRAFKSAATKRINAQRGTPGAPVWQRNYYEHIVRDEESLNRIRQYILDNPLRWAYDRNNPAAVAPKAEGAQCI
jgi:REP element-mobilizing transposase RayT